jgi:AhpD family alkylhydroperoxidase
MTQRLDAYSASPEAIKALVALDATISKLGLEPALQELVRLRASQINGCAYCVDVHSSDARKKGETERRLAALSVWRDTPFFTPRERAALGWTETITAVAQTQVPDADYEALKAHFTAAECVNLTLSINVINSWNRLGIAFRKTVAG